MVQVLLCFGFLVWLAVAFPRLLHFIPDAVRFPSRAGADSGEVFEPVIHGRREAAKYRNAMLLSGTARVVVQSAIIPTVALLMRDAQWTGQFRQSMVVAT